MFLNTIADPAIINSNINRATVRDEIRSLVLPKQPHAIVRPRRRLLQQRSEKRSAQS